MKKLYLAAFVGLTALSTPVLAEAANAFVTANVNLRAGPSTQYPPVLVVPEGSRVSIFGCMQTANWCDVRFAGYRGWISGRYLQALYRDRRVYIDPDYYRPLGIPLITFSLNNYWDRNYRGRDFYRERDHWRRDAPPIPVWQRDRRDGPPPSFMGDGPGPGRDMDRRPDDRRPPFDKGPGDRWPRDRGPRDRGPGDRGPGADHNRPGDHMMPPPNGGQPDMRGGPHGPDQRGPDQRGPNNPGPNNPGQDRPRGPQGGPPQGAPPPQGAQPPHQGLPAPCGAPGSICK